MCPPLTFAASGKINGRGYYIYEKGSKPKPDPSVLSIVEESRKLTNIMPGGKVEKKKRSYENIRSAVIFFILMQSCPSFAAYISI